MLSTPTARGCGTRKKGGVYIDTGLVPVGTPGAQPVEYFLVDPPVRPDKVVTQELGIKPIGVNLITNMDGTVHVLDWVGQNFYPNVADFVEEVRSFGLSRRCELTDAEYASLTPQSNIFLIHPRAWFSDFERLAKVMRRHELLRCPKGMHETTEPLTEMCAGLWWCDITGGDKYGQAPRVRKTMPSFSYFGASHGYQLHYEPAIFARFPIGQLVVVRDPETGGHERAFDRARHSGLPVVLVDE